MEIAPDHAGWLFLKPDAVPEPWRARAVAVALVPLLSSEVVQMLAGDPAGLVARPEDLALMRLLARGASATAIAKQMGIPVRSVHRRIARLREALDADTTAELVARLARAGFDVGTTVPPNDAGTGAQAGERDEGNE